MLKALVVDDHPIVRMGIKQILESTDATFEIIEAGSGKEALSCLKQEKTDIMILDISLPDINGLSLLQEVKQKYPNVKILILSRHHEEHYAIRALKLGALAYVNKKNVTEELREALSRVLQNRRYITAEIADKIVDFALFPENKKPVHTTLSEREYEVFLKLAEGLSVSRCAEMLNLSPNTISTYRQHILEKMGMKSNAQLIRYAVENDLID